jgi:hypothetical protein
MIHPISLKMKNKDWLSIAGLFLLARLIFSAVGILVMNGSEPVSAWVGERIFETHEITVPAWGRLAHLLIDGWFRWDTGWYLKIAALGYSADDGSIVFPPLYPLLIRWIAPFLGRNYLLAALVISNLACLVALFLFFRLAQVYLNSKDQVQNALLYLLAFPTAFYLFAGYSESLFLALTLGAWLLAQRKEWFIAGLAAGLAALTRLQGWLIILPLGWMMLSERPIELAESPVQAIHHVFERIKTRSGIRKTLSRLGHGAWAVFILPSTSFAGYSLWLKYGNLGSIPAAYRQYWNLTVVPPWQGIQLLYGKLSRGHLLLIDWIDFGLFLLFLGLSLVGTVYINPAFSLYIWGTWGLTLMRGYPNQLMASSMRYLLTLFPIFLLMATWIKRRWISALIFTIFLVLQLFLLWVFLNWYWVA